MWPAATASRRLSARRVAFISPWTERIQKPGPIHTLSTYVRVHGRAMPIVWMTVAKVRENPHPPWSDLPNGAFMGSLACG